MSRRHGPWVPLTALLVLHYGAVQVLWIQGQQLVATLLILAATLAVGIRVLEPSAPLLSTASKADPKPHRGPWTGTLVGALVVACAYYGYLYAVEEAWAGLGFCILLAAALLRLNRAVFLPAFDNRRWVFVLFALFVLAAIYRLYLIGQVPVGFCSGDEAAVWLRAQKYYNGERWTYDSPDLNLGADGGIPLYMLMTGLKAFGTSMTGWRMEGALVGILLAGLIFKVGKDIGGRWVGALAAFFWAVSLWPVSVNRAQYYVNETWFIVIACMALFTASLRRGGTWRFVLAGFFWGFCFNVYPAARVMAGLVPWLYFLVWYMVPTRRAELWASVLPVGFGFFVAMAPLLLWMRSDAWAMKAYFVAFNNVGHQGGYLGNGSTLARINTALNRILFEFPRNFALLTKRGPVSAAYFPLQYPTMAASLVALGIVGAGACLARFKEPLHAFLLFWWAAGLVPAMASANTTVPHDRRAMMVLVPTLLLAAVGSVALLRQFWGLASRRSVTRGMFAVGLIALLGAYAWGSWQDYFVRNQRDEGLMQNGRANQALLMRALHAQLQAKPAVVISTWRRDNNEWRGPLDDPADSAEWEATNTGTEVAWFYGDPAHYSNGALRTTLDWAAGKAAAAVAAGKAAPDILVVLMPFYYYLGPTLTRIGGQLVETVPLARSEKGPMVGWDLAYHASEFARIYRIKGAGLELSRLPAPFKIEVAELQPPRGSRQDMRAMDQRSQAYRDATKSFSERPGIWKVLRRSSYMTLDPWFWLTDGNLGGSIASPSSLRMKAQLKIPVAGAYAFGASSTVFTRIWIDGRPVFVRDPLDPLARMQAQQLPAGQSLGLADDLRERRGVLGPPVDLKEGPHTFEVEQAMFGISPSYNHLLRPIWKAPGGEVETLPLEVLNP